MGVLSFFFNIKLHRAIYIQRSAQIFSRWHSESVWNVLDPAKKEREREMSPRRMATRNYLCKQGYDKHRLASKR